MSANEIYQIIGMVIAINATFFVIFFFATKIKNPTVNQNKKKLQNIENDQKKINSKINEIINCIENITSSTVAGTGNIQYILNQYILKDEDEKKKRKLLHSLGSTAINTNRASLELKLLYKSGPDLVSAAQQLVEKVGDIHTIKKFEIGIQALPENDENKIILQKYLKRLKNRLNKELEK